MNQIKLELTSFLATFVVFAALVVLPLGVAGQNIGLGVALFFFLILTFKDRAQSLKKVFSLPLLRQFLVLWSLIVIPILIATVVKGDMKQAYRFFWGYFYSGLIIPMSLSLKDFKIHSKFLAYVVLFIASFMGIVATSQFLFGWKFESKHFVSSIHRAQGFYSHPLTFAYVVCLFWPWVTVHAFSQTSKNLSKWVLLISIGIMIVTSQSVTVIAGAGLVFVFLAMTLLPLKQKILGAFLAMILGTLTVTVPNPIQQKFSMVLSGERIDRETGYKDDRLAFWHAHWLMFMDKPFTGHGAGLEAEDRQPYYEKIGLGHIERMYEAHNMYLQYAVEGGIIPALTLLSLLVWWFLSAKKSKSLDIKNRLVFLVLPVFFGLVGMTQNAIQDSEVRYMLFLQLGFFGYFTLTETA